MKSAICFYSGLDDQRLGASEPSDSQIAPMRQGRENAGFLHH